MQIYANFWRIGLNWIKVDFCVLLRLNQLVNVAKLGLHDWLMEIRFCGPKWNSDDSSFWKIVLTAKLIDQSDWKLDTCYDYLSLTNIVWFWVELWLWCLKSRWKIDPSNGILVQASDYFSRWNRLGFAKPWKFCRIKWKLSCILT